MPLYASPMLGDTTEIFFTVDSSTNVERSFFYVASTTQFIACHTSKQRVDWHAAVRSS